MIESVHSVEPDIDPQIDRRQVMRRRRRWIGGVVLLLVLLIAVPPWINISRFRRTIVQSISAGLGRPVEASSVELQLFPRPGFVLHDLTVGEDSAFGAEPVMMAHTVTASLRASTLWHARVEIASLRFDTPSLNLVRDPDGHWNFESLLHHSPALHSGGAAGVGQRLPFPYVEATDARVNFKRGAEKLPFSLERAHLEVWRESGNQWRLRIRANPVRTDLSVEDAGQIRGEGALTTGGALMNAPIQASFEWRQVQLGEISRMLHGEDDGWRGTVDWTAEARGTLADVALTSDIAVEEFRRAEFIPAGEMDLSAHCQVRYARYNKALDSLACVAPVGDGHVWLRGFAAAPDSSAGMDSANASPVQIALDHVSAGFLLDLLGHVHPGVAADTAATGEVNGHADCAWSGLHIPEACTGEVRADTLRLRLAGLDQSLMLAPVVLASDEPAANWKLAPVHVLLGGAAPGTLVGTLDADGVALHMSGPADLTELNRLAQALKIPALSGEVQSIRGNAELALTMQSRWLGGIGDISDGLSSAMQPGMAPSQWRGDLMLQNATLKLAALPAPIELASARVDLTPTGVQWTGLKGTFAHIPFDGSVQWQTPCAAANTACGRSFALHSASLNVDRLEATLRKGASSSDLLDLINPWAAGTPRIPEMMGTFRADILTLGRVAIKNAELKLQLQGQGAELTGVSGRVFGGTISGMTNEAGSMRWGDGAPQYVLRVRLDGVQPDRLGAVWHEGWGGGVANADLDLKMQGWSAAELAENAGGKFDFEWRNGVFPGTAAATSIGKFGTWSGQGTIHDQVLIFDSGRMDFSSWKRKGSSPAQSVTGTATFGRVLDLRLAPSGDSITGTLSAPVLMPSSGTASGVTGVATRHP